ncbi:MAG: imidazole glycerol phosphate synthase subunit HisF [Phycisphaerales bacterium]|nr:imidazole glycerol phosphate synthase subunit HisF [Phycisphaerales bacterium]
MLTTRVIPCLDVADGRVVKGIRLSGLRDAGDTVEQATAYEAQGADEIVMLDVSATNEGRRAAIETVRAVREVLAIPLTVGGGVRVRDDAIRLLDAGADRVSLNTAAVADPGLLDELATRVGVQCVVLAIDASRDGGRWRVRTHGGREVTALDAIDWASEGERRGAGELLVTSWDRDGTGEGYDLDLLRALRERVRIPIIASGGASGAAHMIEAVHAGADAVLAATIFHDGHRTVADVKQDLALGGVEVRR